MESPVNSEEAVSTTKEPVKAEEPAPSNSGDRSDDASPPPNCSICLGKLINTSFTDSCLHQFCFNCLLQWSRIKTECPLCKQTFKSIIHNVRSEGDYDQYHVPVQASASTTTIDFALASVSAMRRFAYHTTMTSHHRRLRPLVMRLEANLEPSIPLPMEQEQRRSRRNVYRTGEWSDIVPDLNSRFRQNSADYYRRFPQEIERLIPWINRDLQTIFNTNQQHIAYVLRVITDLLTRYDMRTDEFHNVLRPYFGIHTDHFIHELMNYARTDLTMTAYDNLITYLRMPGTRGLSRYTNQIPSSSSNSNSSASDDSEVLIVSHVDRTDAEPPSVGPHLLSIPGPSTISQTFHAEHLTDSRPCVLTISTSSSESECEIVGYVKPRHERTPEIIELVSSDEEAVVNTVCVEDTPKSPSPQPSTSHPSTSHENDRRYHKNNKSKTTTRMLNYMDYLASSDSTISSDSDSDSSYSQTKKRSSHRKKRLSSKSSRGTSHKNVPPKKREISRKRNVHSSSSSENNKEPKKRRTLNGARTSHIDYTSNSDDDCEVRNVDKKSKYVESDSKLTNVRARKDSVNNSWKHSSAKLVINTNNCTSDSSSDSSSTSSSSSTSCMSSSSSNSSYKKSRRKYRSRQQKDSGYRFSSTSNNSDDNNRRPSKSRLKSAVTKINRTVLRKDNNKTEWYVHKKNSSRSRSRSRSSYDSECDDDSRKRAQLNEYKEKRAAQKIANEKIKNESLYFLTDSQNDEESLRSNSQCSEYSERSKTDKHKRKNSSNSSKLKKNKSRKKSSKDFRDKQKKSKRKSKRNKRHKDNSSSSSC